MLEHERIIATPFPSVYIGTNGRGIFYGDIAGSAPVPTTTAGPPTTTSTTILRTTTPLTTSSSTRSTTVTTATTTTSSGGQAPAGAFGQCGGQGWTGATTCIAGYTCMVQNSCEFFRLCRVPVYQNSPSFSSLLSMCSQLKKSQRNYTVDSKSCKTSNTCFTRYERTIDTIKINTLFYST